MAQHHESVGISSASANAGKTASQTAPSGGRRATARSLDDASNVVPLHLPALPLRAGTIAVRDLIDLYMAHYAGRDASRVWHMNWWAARLGDVQLQDLSDDQVHAALEELSERHARYFAGKDADGKPIHRAKRKPLSGATINRYAAGLAAVVTWAIKKRIAPKGYVHPCRSVERRPESDGRVRFLSDAERERLLDACRASKWPRLYLLVMLALTTGARRGELLSMKWADVDLERAVAHVGRSKNGDAKSLPLMPAVISEMRRFVGAAHQPVFSSPRSINKVFTFEPSWHAALKAAGIKAFRFHDLRHSCASTLAQNGATLLEIADVLGHRQLAMTKRYSHLTTQHKAALLQRVMGAIK